MVIGIIGTLDSAVTCLQGHFSPNQALRRKMKYDAQQVQMSRHRNPTKYKFPFDLGQPAPKTPSHNNRYLIGPIGNIVSPFFPNPEQNPDNAMFVCAALRPSDPAEVRDMSLSTALPRTRRRGDRRKHHGARCEGFDMGRRENEAYVVDRRGDVVTGQLFGVALLGQRPHDATVTSFGPNDERPLDPDEL